MKPKTPSSQKQGHLLYPDLLNLLNPKTPLLVLARRIPWETLEREFVGLYVERGRPAKPIRLMVGLLLLKQIVNLSDERVVDAWVQNPYFQAICGMEYFQWKVPCDPSELVHFRKRIGEVGFEKFFKVPIELHGENSLEAEVIIDTTVQEKNITFPTDTKLRVRVIDKCWKLENEENIKLRRSYRRESRETLRVIRFSKSQKDKKKVRAAIRRVKTMANALLRDVARKLPQSSRSTWHAKLEQYQRAVDQERHDKKKIYSLHEPDASCICKGKEHKKYEFGSKSAIVMTKTHGIIIGAKSFPGNPYDGDTLKDTLADC